MAKFGQGLQGAQQALIGKFAAGVANPVEGPLQLAEHSRLVRGVDDQNIIHLTANIPAQREIIIALLEDQRTLQPQAGGQGVGFGNILTVDKNDLAHMPLYFRTDLMKPGVFNSRSSRWVK